MTNRKNARRRAFTLVEMCVSMAVMGIVMSFAALEFKDVVFTFLDADSHLSAEQQARVAVAKVNDLARQASVVDNTNPNSVPAPAIIQPSGSSPGPVLEFTKAQTLDLKTLPLTNGVPVPCYDDVMIFVVQDSVVPSSDPILQPHNLVERISPFDQSRAECVSVNPNKQPDLRLIARNVEDFSVQTIESCDTSKEHCTPYGQGYRIDISIFGYDENKADQHSGALYHLSSVITPLTYGASE